MKKKPAKKKTAKKISDRNWRRRIEDSIVATGEETMRELLTVNGQLVALRGFLDRHRERIDGAMEALDRLVSRVEVVENDMAVYGDRIGTRPAQKEDIHQSTRHITEEIHRLGAIIHGGERP